MKRKDIKGFTVNLFGYATEFVFIRYKLAVIAIYKNNNRELIKRLGA